MAVNSDSGHQGLTNIFQKSLDDLRNLIACRICMRPMYEPYTTQCGHTFCYSCLRQWFDSDRIKKTCPDCRAHVQSQPAPAFLIREITQTFVNTAVLLPAGETTEDHSQSQREEAEFVEKDKASHVSGGGLFNGRFNRSARYRAPIRDSPDGVDRCPRCTWELEDGMCNSCGYTDNLSISDETTMTFDDDMSMYSDHSDISLAAERLLAEIPNRTGDRAEHSRRRHNQIHHRMGSALETRRRRLHSILSTSDSMSDGDLTDRSVNSRSTGSPGSLRAFVADETMRMDDIGANLDTSNMPTSGSNSGSEHLSDHDEPSSPPFDFTANGRRRFRGRRVAMSSPEPSVSDSDTTQSTQHTGHSDEDNPMPGGFSPLLSSPVGGHFHDVPIQVDSDSDAPPIRPAGRRRRRTAAMSISSDEGTSGTRGVDISRLPSSPKSDTTARNGAPLSTASNSPHSSVVAESNTAQLTSPSRSPSPNLNVRNRLLARHRRLISSTSSEDASVEGDDLHNIPSISSRNISTIPQNAHVRERSERPFHRSGSPSNVQHRLERKRLKRQLQARQRRERLPGGDWNRAIPHQQLAYIGG
ncbi:MAG: hypothetical protein Q9169_001847 [Polycauliona sp. 2 TL-2023]